MWKAAYYRKQAELFLALARLTHDRDKAARYAFAASRYFEKAERAFAKSALQPAE